MFSGRVVAKLLQPQSDSLSISKRPATNRSSVCAVIDEATLSSKPLPVTGDMYAEYTPPRSCPFSLSLGHEIILPTRRSLCDKMAGKSVYPALLKPVGAVRLSAYDLQYYIPQFVRVCSRFVVETALHMRDMGEIMWYVPRHRTVQIAYRTVCITQLAKSARKRKHRAARNCGTFRCQRYATRVFYSMFFNIFFTESAITFWLHVTCTLWGDTRLIAHEALARTLTSYFILFIYELTVEQNADTNIKQEIDLHKIKYVNCKTSKQNTPIQP